MASILGRTSVEMEADVIFTAALLGFAAVHAELGHKYSFESYIDGKEKTLETYQEFLDLLSALTSVLEANQVDIGSALGDGLSPDREGGHDRAICGWPGGQAMMPHNRVFHRDDRVDTPRSDPHQAFNLEAATIHGQSYSSERGYLGPGAYTGAIKPASGGELVFSSTTQCKGVPQSDRFGEPERRGLLKGAHDKSRPEGFGPPPPGSLFGYVHGMSFAMRDALVAGPHVVALEVASGPKTTKLASCFACTLYMWSAGFPPSSTHLGSSLSWHPLLASEHDGKQLAVVESMNTRFHLAVHEYLMRGAKYLQVANRSNVFFITDTRKEIAVALENKQRQRTERAHLVGANYFLDALTHHKNDYQRVKDTVLSHYEGGKDSRIK